MEGNFVVCMCESGTQKYKPTKICVGTADITQTLDPTPGTMGDCITKLQFLLGSERGALAQ